MLYFQVMDGTKLTDFAGWLRDHRRAKKMKQYEVARSASVSPSYISTLERKQPHTVTGVQIRPEREKVVAIARAVGGDVDEALILCGYAPESSVPIPDKIKIIGFEGFSDSDIDSIVDFIMFKHRTKEIDP